jgi:hypothetical protein
MIHKIAHRLHLAFDESMLEIEPTRLLGVVGEKCDAEKFFITRKADSVLQEARAVAASTMIAVNP